MRQPRAAIVLAAGKGKRMNSELPKVLHEIHGRTMVAILLDTLVAVGFDRIVVVIGHQGELVQQALAGYPVRFVWQRDQLGTGHAVKMAYDELGNFHGTTLVVAGDVPLLSAQTITGLIDQHERTKSVATCLSAVFDDPAGYGRIIRARDGITLAGIVEHKDATPEELAIREVNSGTFCFDTQKLFEVIRQIGNQNSQGEYYLTDAVKILHNKGLLVSVVAAENPDEVQGVNSVEQLEELAEKFPQKR
jgi:bifunctional UDP-N-acetylglucosamine pyrophosphorylase / glucosamine-1-phosphate N-acetyltransferase